MNRERRNIEWPERKEENRATLFGWGALARLGQRRQESPDASTAAQATDAVESKGTRERLPPATAGRYNPAAQFAPIQRRYSERPPATRRQIISGTS